MSTLKPTKKNIFFQFLDKTSRNCGKLSFGESTDWGFDIAAGQQQYDESAKKPRWGVVTAVGPGVETEDVDVDSIVLIEALKWTPGFEFEDETYWSTDLAQIMCVKDAESVEK